MKIQMFTSVITSDFHYGGGEIYVVGDLISEELAKKFIEKQFAKLIEEEDVVQEKSKENIAPKKIKKKAVKDIEN